MYLHDSRSIKSQIPIGLIKWEWLTFLLVTQDLSLLSASLVSNFWLWPLGTIYKQLVSYCLKVRRVEKNLCGLNSQRRSLRKWLLTSISSLATKRDIDNIAILLQIMCQDIHYYHMSHWSHKGGRTPQSPHTSPQSSSNVENSSRGMIYILWKLRGYTPPLKGPKVIYLLNM